MYYTSLAYTGDGRIREIGMVHAGAMSRHEACHGFWLGPIQMPSELTDIRVDSENWR
jgi:hypothetical protein